MTVHELLCEQCGDVRIGKPGSSRAVWSEDGALRKEYVAALRAELAGCGHVFPVFCDAAGCAQFEDWMDRAGEAVERTAEEKGIEVRSWADRRAELGDGQIDDFYIAFEDLFSDLLYKDMHVFLVVENFEQACKWEDNMAWARYFFGREFRKGLNDLPAQADLSTVIVADRDVDDITGSKPESSSSFANVFYNTTYRLERKG